MVETTISCDAVILRCSSCQAEIAGTVDSGACSCGGFLLFRRSCGVGFTLRSEGSLIRSIAENKDGWGCGARDFCPGHTYLAPPARAAQIGVM